MFVLDWCEFWSVLEFALFFSNGLKNISERLGLNYGYFSIPIRETVGRQKLNKSTLLRMSVCTKPRAHSSLEAS